MKSKIFIIVGIVIMVAVGFYFWQRSKIAHHVHLHAGFQVYVNGKLQDFSSARYMSLIPCGDTDPANEQLSKAHLHDNVGDVVHVHREKATWKDLFQNINVNIVQKGPITAFINGTKVDNILNEEIKPYDSVVILVGTYDKNKNYLSQAVKKNKIIETEKNSELCGS